MKMTIETLYDGFSFGVLENDSLQPENIKGLYFKTSFSIQ